MIDKTTIAMSGLFPYIWLIVKDGDSRVSDIYKRHYSCYQYADGRRNNTANRNRHLVMGPGEKLVLMTGDCKAIFGWRKFIDAAGQEGVNCSFFRNEGAYDGMLSSQLILAAEKLAAAKWPNERLYTYVAAGKVKSTNPGYCFKMAGWKPCGHTKTRGLLILEKF